MYQSNEEEIRNSSRNLLKTHKFPSLKNIALEGNFQQIRLSTMKILNKVIESEEMIKSQRKNAIFHHNSSFFLKKGFDFLSIMKGEHIIHFDENARILIENSEFCIKQAKYDDLIDSDDNEIIRIMTHFRGLSSIWDCGVLDMKEKFMLWEGENKDFELKAYHKAIIWNLLQFNVENFTQIGLECNQLLKKLLRVVKHVNNMTLEFIWEFLCIS